MALGGGRNFMCVSARRLYGIKARRRFTNVRRRSEAWCQQIARDSVQVRAECRGVQILLKRVAGVVSRHVAYTSSREFGILYADSFRLPIARRPAACPPFRLSGQLETRR